MERMKAIAARDVMVGPLMGRESGSVCTGEGQDGTMAEPLVAADGCVVAGG